MHARAAALIARLALAPHPEGGFFREVFRSPETVQPGSGPPRAALTTIYFLLTRGHHSRWHRVRSDELWHFYEGDDVELFRAPPDLSRLERVRLGLASAAGDAGNALPLHAMPAGWWQAARTSGEFSFVGCTVGPGFDFSDLDWMRDEPRRVEALARLAPDMAALA